MERRAGLLQLLTDIYQRSSIGLQDLYYTAECLAKIRSDGTSKLILQSAGLICFSTKLNPSALRKQ